MASPTADADEFYTLRTLMLCIPSARGIFPRGRGRLNRGAIGANSLVKEDRGGEGGTRRGNEAPLPQGGHSGGSNITRELGEDGHGRADGP